MTIKVLIVDDSAFMRKVISDMMKELSGIEVVGTARNGYEALDFIAKNSVDIVTLDVEMPGMNGIETLKEIKARYTIPVIMLSSNKNPEVTIEALELGAIDFIEKPVNIGINISEIKDDIERKIRSILTIKPGTDRQVVHKAIKKPPSKRKFDALVVGASTGGPKALVYLVSRLPADTKLPIFIVQHMPKGFTASLAERMDRESALDVVEAKNGMLIKEGTVYLAPGDFHMVVRGESVFLETYDKIHGVRPAVDYLFETASQKYGDKLLAALLTGMGRDGTEGMIKIRRSGGYNLAQDKETSTIFGMPGNAIANGVVDEVLSLEDMSETINRLVR
ncbi:MAG: chemotaxis response regulator protein-glutamate methylesterase [Gudongella sp.]|jgi:two-component system chemotaxis response regulator CheB|nr:chemotaxis response regulator protein-glutamate methylesterase [Gudongella sp.]